MFNYGNADEPVTHPQEILWIEYFQVMINGTKAYLKDYA
jgi:hypothetical protein